MLMFQSTKRHYRACAVPAIVAVVLCVACAVTPIHAQTVQWKGRLYKDYYFWDIACADSVHCLAVASYQLAFESMILRTSDGGVTWDSVYTEHSVLGKGAIPTFVSVAMPTRSRAMVVADSGLVIRTTDGGATWKRDRIAGKATVQWISMADSLHALVGLRADTNSLMATSDGGETWEAFALPQEVRTMGITDVANPRPNAFVVLMGWYPDNAVLRSDDRGRTWHVYRNVLPDSSGGNLWFTDSLTGWVGASVHTGVGDRARAVISKTTDGGATWETQLDEEIGRRYGLSDIVFVNADSGLAVGGVGTVLRTTNGGATWVVEPTDVEGLHVLHVAYPPGSRGIVVTTLGRVELPEDRTTGVSLGPLGAADTVLPFPNPVPRSGQLRLRFASPPSGPVQLTLVSALGQAVRQVDVPEAAEAIVDVVGLPGGPYVLRRTAGGRSTSSVVWVGEP